VIYHFQDCLLAIHSLLHAVNGFALEVPLLDLGTGGDLVDDVDTGGAAILAGETGGGSVDIIDGGEFVLAGGFFEFGDGAAGGIFVAVFVFELELAEGVGPLPGVVAGGAAGDLDDGFAGGSGELVDGVAALLHALDGVGGVDVELGEFVVF
jgi:hypothetical protein